MRILQSIAKVAPIKMCVTALRPHLRVLSISLLMTLMFLCITWVEQWQNRHSVDRLFMARDLYDQESWPDVERPVVDSTLLVSWFLFRLFIKVSFGFY